MCGITGIFARSEKGVSYLARLQPAMQAMAHRGPDHQGTYYHKQVALGHVRLSIIDLSAEAHQPFTDETGRFVIIYNGEIYNYKEIRQELENRGHSFRTGSDTEVLLKLWITDGSAGLDRLNGFFAFAVYDNLEETIHLVRDRYGIKPLLYYFDEDVFVFGSEMKSLFALDIPRVLNQEALLAYLQLNYLPPSFSMIEGVQKLSPGYYARISKDEVTWHQYYKIPFREGQDYTGISYESAVQRVRTLVDEAVERRLVSDVPLGAFLSGGLDSSIVAARAKEHAGRLQTFAIGFSDHAYYDESKVAARVAKHLGTDHTTIMVGSDELLSCLPAMLDQLDEPFADSSALAVYLLSQRVKEHVTVALTGDGADELFGGYLKHSAEWHARNLGITGKLAIRIAPYLKVFPQSRANFISNKLRQIGRFSDSVRLPMRDRYWSWCSITSEESAYEMLKKTPDFEAYTRNKVQFCLSDIGYKGDFNEILLSDMKLVLPGDMLVKADMMSMAHALELRSPFLDRELVDYIFTLPADFKTGPTIRKKILRDAFAADLPDEVIQRPKHGFEVPMLNWMRTDLKDLIFNDLLAEDFLEAQGIFRIPPIRQMKNQLLSRNPGDVQARIWAMIVFQHWYKKYMPNV